MSAKAHKPTPEVRAKVEAYVACGTSVAGIAMILGIGEATLKRHYKRELGLGHVLANARVARSLFDLATNEKHPPSARVQASVAWLKLRAGWKEASDDAPRLNVTAQNVNIDASTKVLAQNVRNLDDDALRQLTEMLGRLLPAPDDKP